MFNFETILEWGKFAGYPIIVVISFIGIRFILYFHSFFFRWSRYRQLETVTTNDIRALASIPFVKIQITTRGSLGSTEVIRRGIENVIALVKEAPDVYSTRLSVEVVTESQEQKHELERDFARSPVSIQVFVLPGPGQYETPKRTLLKARALHYMVQLRRTGVNRKPGKTFIVHYDEESVMEPDELRKLIRYLATTDKQLTEGPIYYPLEYTDASAFCRAMEANRPIGCFECREVMESGTPLHLHGSNLVIDEELENELGWDIGNLDGQPFIAEDYVFGALAFVKRGPHIFGWHGCVMLEQPPFSLKSAFRQRYRWIIGVLQGMTLVQRMPEFSRLPRKMRFRLIWGTRYRILTFALGLPTGAISFLYILYQSALVLLYGEFFLPLPVPLMIWMLFVGFLWLNSIFIGSWYNISSARELSASQRWAEVGRVITLAPIAGILESAAGFWAVVQWTIGNRKVSWQPTPKTRQADNVLHLKPVRSNRKIGWRLGVASFVTLLLLGLSFQWLSITGTSSFSPIILPHPLFSWSGGERDSTTSSVVQFRRPDFQTGVVFPQWGTNAYSADDSNWGVGLKDIQEQTSARWVELPINFYQASITSTQVMTTDQTPTPEAVAEGIRLARAKNYSVFVVPLLTVEGPPGPLTWSGSIRFATLQQTEEWFESYWQVFSPYVKAAEEAGAQQLAIGTEDELLQEAPASLWNRLIERIHAIYHGKLTYDINWSSLYYPLPPWLRHPYLNAIGVSVYFPLIDRPERISPVLVPGLWRDKIKTFLDRLSLQVSKPVIVSEIGYRDSAYTFYRPLQRDAAAGAEPPDPAEQAAGYDAALSNVITDSHISGIFFWAWSLPLFEPNWKPAAKILHKWYTSYLA